MFGVDSSEFLIIILVAAVVIGPKDLPRVLRTVGQWVGKARGMANQFRSGVDQMVRDSEIADLEKKWREQNDAIMKANPMAPPDTNWGVPDSAAAEPGPVMLDKPAAMSPSKPSAPPSLAKKGRRPAAPKPIVPSYPAPRAGDEA